MSRMILAALVSRHQSEVATWGRQPGGVGQVHAQHARDLRWLRSRHARDKLAVRVQQACCARSSAHDMGTTRAMCTRPGFWVCALCTQPSFVTVHYLGSLFGHYSWTLFKNTVHRVKKKIFYHCSTKILKIFLGLI